MLFDLLAARRWFGLKDGCKSPAEQAHSLLSLSGPFQQHLVFSRVLECLSEPRNQMCCLHRAKTSVRPMRFVQTDPILRSSGVQVEMQHKREKRRRRRLFSQKIDVKKTWRTKTHQPL